MDLFAKFKSTFTSKHYKYLSKFAFAQIFLASITPLFSRIYSPTDLGIGSLFITTCLLLSTFTSLSLENVFFIEDEEDCADCFVITVFICFLTSLIISFFPIDFLFQKFFGLDSNPIFNKLLPLTLILIGLNNILKAYANKKGYYTLLGLNKNYFFYNSPNVNNNFWFF